MLISNNLAKKLGPEGPDNNKAGIKVVSELNKGSEFSFIIEDKNLILNESCNIDDSFTS